MTDLEYRRLGSTGLEISPICLGVMSFGDASRGGHPWVLAEDEARPLIKRAVDAGINFFDTANVYSDGIERGDPRPGAARLRRPRGEVVATKVHGEMRPGPNGRGLSRKAIFAEVDNSLTPAGDGLRRPAARSTGGTTHTPIEETLEALHDVVKAGKARYLGASSMYAWQFSKALYLADRHGWTRFVSMQNHYNLLYREEEREMIPLCADQGIGLIPWSPLARGRLTRDWDETTDRSETDAFGAGLYREGDREIVAAVAAVAEERGVPRAQVALAWLLGRPAGERSDRRRDQGRIISTTRSPRWRSN